jgi:hypothetical protein
MEMKKKKPAKIRVPCLQLLQSDGEFNVAWAHNILEFKQNKKLLEVSAYWSTYDIWHVQHML